MGRVKTSTQQVSRPKRKATNAHVFRYLQTRNPSKLEENDLKRALEASLEECPDFWPEDTASCSSSEQSNSNSSSTTTNTATTNSSISARSPNNRLNHRCHSMPANSNRNQCNNKSGKAFRRTNKRCSSMQPNLLKHAHQANHPHHHHHGHNNYLNLQSTSSPNSANPNCCPMSSAHNRYKPVAKKNIYQEADFFHDGIMEYIEFALSKTRSDNNYD